MHRKGTLRGLLTNFFGFTSFSDKIGLIRTSVDRAYRINNSLAKFDDDVKKLYYILKKNQYPEGLINKVFKSYLDKVHNSNHSTPPRDTSIIYFKPPILDLGDQYTNHHFSEKEVEDQNLPLWRKPCPSALGTRICP